MFHDLQHQQRDASISPTGTALSMGPSYSQTIDWSLTFSGLSRDTHLPFSPAGGRGWGWGAECTFFLPFSTGVGAPSVSKRDGLDRWNESGMERERHGLHVLGAERSVENIIPVLERCAGKTGVEKKWIKKERFMDLGSNSNVMKERPHWPLLQLILHR